MVTVYDLLNVIIALMNHNTSFYVLNDGSVDLLLENYVIRRLRKL